MQTHTAACALLCLGVCAATACSSEVHHDPAETQDTGGTASRAAAGGSARGGVRHSRCDAAPRTGAGAPAADQLEPAGDSLGAGAPPMTSSTGGLSSSGSSSPSAGRSAVGGTSTEGAAAGNEQAGGTAATTGGATPSTGAAAPSTGGVLIGGGGTGSDPVPVGGAGGNAACGDSAAGAATTTGSAFGGGAAGAGTEPAGAPPLVITELMFNPRSSPELEWVELCNTTGAAISLTGYTLWDDDNDDSIAPNFPVGTALPAESCVVLTHADDVASFAAAWGEEIPVVGLPAFPTLTNSGDRVQLWDPLHPPVASDVDAGTNTVISFDYSGSLGDGSGSIELTTIAANPSLRESWALSTVEAGASITSVGDVGTPGVAP